jgi:hypothetical protein
MKLLCCWRTEDAVKVTGKVALARLPRKNLRWHAFLALRLATNAALAFPIASISSESALFTTSRKV